MEVKHEQCAGLDVHMEVVVACARCIKGAVVKHDTREFATTTTGLYGLADWLEEHGCTHVAMEATGVYWKPVWHILEERFELLLANAAHVRNVPGRKSDVNDARWLADLLAHGLISASFVPPAPIQELRDLTRTRKQLVREVSQHTLRIQKTLEDANIKLTGVVSEMMGVSGRAIIHALISGETDPERLLACTNGRLKAPRERLIEGLRGRVTEHHRFMLRLHMDQIQALERGITTLELEATRIVEPFHDRVELLRTIPGVSYILAQTIVAEIGIDMDCFPTSGHLVSWAGLCPRMDESAGKRRSTRLRHGAPWLKTMLVTSAWAASNVKKSYFHAQFLRIRSRRGHKKAVVAVAASMLTAAYFILRDGKPFHDLGADYFDKRDRTKVIRRLTRRIEALGYSVEVKPAA